MTALAWRKIAGWSGIAFVVVFLASEAPLADAPALDESAAGIRQWFEANETQLVWSIWGSMLALAFFVLFASGVRSLLEPAEAGSRGMWSRWSFAGATAAFALAGAKTAFWAVLNQEDVAAVASDETFKTLAAFEAISLTVFIPWSLAVFLAGAAVVVLQSGVMARWLGWLGVVTAVLFAVGALWPLTGDAEGALGILVFLGYVGWLAWTVGAGVTLIRAEAEAGP